MEALAKHEEVIIARASLHKKAAAERINRI